MPRFAANISLLYGEHAFPDRIAAAARDGFGAVECIFPYAHAARELRQRLDDAGLPLVLMNATPRSRPEDRGVAALPGRETEFREAFMRALDYAQEAGCEQLHVMAGNVPEGADRAVLRQVYVDNLAWACERAGPRGLRVLVEPINPADMPAFFLRTQEEAHAIVRDVGASNLQVQMDLYHVQRVEGDAAAALARYLPSGRVGHLQMAGVPLRHEPDEGELDLPALMAQVDALGFTGWVGAEYNPRGATSAGLAWLRALGIPPRG